MKKILVILGPTASGKTDLGLNLAKKFNGELVACDSRQVYKGLDIGTGKWPSQKAKIKKQKNYWIINGVKIWMYDIASPKRQYTVADYVKDAEKAINEITSNNKLPIIVGGSGLYLKALLDGLPNLRVSVDKKLRKKLEKLSVEDLQKKLLVLSSETWRKMNYSDQQNPRRLIRQIELVPMYGYMNTKNYELKFKYFKVLKIGLTAPREVLYKKIDQRVLSRMKHGMLQEAVILYKNGLSLKRMRSLGLEYGVLADFLQGKIKTKEELIKIMQGKIHGYLRRQQTWFKKPQDIFWFDITDLNYIEKVEHKVQAWYN